MRASAPRCAPWFRSQAVLRRSMRSTEEPMSRGRVLDGYTVKVSGPAPQPRRRRPSGRLPSRQCLDGDSRYGPWGPPPSPCASRFSAARRLGCRNARGLPVFLSDVLYATLAALITRHARTPLSPRLPDTRIRMTRGALYDVVWSRLGPRAAASRSALPSNPGGRLVQAFPSLAAADEKKTRHLTAASTLHDNAGCYLSTTNRSTARCSGRPTRWCWAFSTGFEMPSASAWRSPTAFNPWRRAATTASTPTTIEYNTVCCFFTTPRAPVFDEWKRLGLAAARRALASCATGQVMWSPPRVPTTVVLPGDSADRTAAVRAAAQLEFCAAPHHHTFLRFGPLKVRHNYAGGPRW